MDEMITNLGAGKSDKIITKNIAGQTINAFRVVILLSDNKIYYADNQTPEHFDKILGLSLNAAIIDENVKILRYGIYENNSWTFDNSKSLYLATNGEITQTANTSGFICKIGEVINSTKILLDIKSCINLI